MLFRSLRESPALFIAEQLKMYKDINLIVVEPNVELDILNKYFDSAEIYDIKNALKSADIIVSLVAHSPFKDIDKTLIESKVLLDCCKLFKKPQASNMVCDWQAKERNETGLS